MSRLGNPAFDAGVALARHDLRFLRRSLDRMIEPASPLLERLSDRGLDLLVEKLGEVAEDFVAGVRSVDNDSGRRD
jgi:hypothetical protein